MKPWETHFDERHLKEIAFCREYARNFAHGTDGHHKFMIIAKMADQITNIPKERYWKENFMEFLNEVRMVNRI